MRSIPLISALITLCAQFVVIFAAIDVYRYLALPMIITSTLYFFDVRQGNKGAWFPALMWGGNAIFTIIAF